MAPPHKLQKLAQPLHGFFDVYNSSSTGHQVGDGGAVNRKWIKHRTKQLQLQFSVADRPLQKGSEDGANLEAASEPITTTLKTLVDDRARTEVTVTEKSSTPPQIFKDCCVYVNGLNAPGISDLDLRHKLVSHGARISLQLAKKAVTHVIVSESNKTSAMGVGGGLAAGKIQKEIRATRNRIRYVKAEWVLDSIAADRKLSEAKYTVLTAASAGQRPITATVSRRRL